MPVEISLNPNLISAIPQIGIALMRGAPNSYRVRGIEAFAPIEVRATGSADPLSWGQYGPQSVNATPAWNRTRGAGVTIAVLDSGIAPHEDLSGLQIVRPSSSEVDGSTSDPCGHGTAVTGVFAAGIHNGIGITGLADNVAIIPYQVLRADLACKGTSYYVAFAIVLAVTQGANVILMSLAAGNPGDSSPHDLDLAIRFATERGVTIVVAAGNTGDASVTPPADEPAVISVTATDSKGDIASFASTSTQVTLGAPGASILTLDREGGYGVWNGTSMAAPHVAAAAALILSLYPSTCPKAIKNHLIATAGRSNDGIPRLNIGAAVMDTEPMSC